ncbi:hypothetical protein CYMTET_42980 [Cymbomonas tetramitiformis]|uniref:Uncharacterized protein n=1 Tax=Cymbomonas tetramitiformis TaxID=36881 RepID=A0AAE0C4D5_9CHLO|nr:hypothetical protein CYMTET_42980 [Cymbomonas tetramitiformis]
MGIRPISFGAFIQSVTIPKPEDGTLPDVVKSAQDEEDDPAANSLDDELLAVLDEFSSPAVVNPLVVPGGQTAQPPSSSLHGKTAQLMETATSSMSRMKMWQAQDNIARLESQVQQVSKHLEGAQRKITHDERRRTQARARWSKAFEDTRTEEEREMRTVKEAEVYISELEEKLDASFGEMEQLQSELRMAKELEALALQAFEKERRSSEAKQADADSKLKAAEAEWQVANEERRTHASLVEAAAAQQELCEEEQVKMQAQLEEAQKSLQAALGAAATAAEQQEQLEQFAGRVADLEAALAHEQAQVAPLRSQLKEAEDMTAGQKQANIESLKCAREVWERQRQELCCRAEALEDEKEHLEREVVELLLRVTVMEAEANTRAAGAVVSRDAWPGPLEAERQELLLRCSQSEQREAALELTLAERLMEHLEASAGDGSREQTPLHAEVERLRATNRQYELQARQNEVMVQKAEAWQQERALLTAELERLRQGRGELPSQPSTPGTILRQVASTAHKGDPYVQQKEVAGSGVPGFPAPPMSPVGGGAVDWSKQKAALEKRADDMQAEGRLRMPRSCVINPRRSRRNDGSPRKRNSGGKDSAQL